MKGFANFMMALLLANLMVWFGSEAIRAIGLFSIIFILMMDNLAEATGEKK